MKKKTFVPKPEDVNREWLLVDAKDQTLGRLCARIALVLKGKHKAIYSPHVLCGDYVVVLNSKDIKVTGKKMDDKKYQKYTGYPSGQKEKSLKEMMALNCNEVIRHAVKGMLPKNTLAKDMLNSLKIYEGDEHPHAAQNPKKVEL